MASFKEYIQAPLELFHERRARNIARELDSALKAAEAITKHLREHNRLLKEISLQRKELEAGE